MSTIKYSNGMYKSTSKKQEDQASKIFSFLKRAYPACTMGYMFNQVNGNLVVNIKDSAGYNIDFVINRRGIVL